MLVRDIEKALGESEREAWNYGPTLARGALVHLCRHIDESQSPFTVLELGGGHSTFLWQALQSLGLLDVRAVTLLHEPQQADELTKRTAQGGAITVRHSGLKQITDDEWERVFADGSSAAANWASLGASVSADRYRHYTIRNTFYDDIELPLADHVVDAMIVDGPHGNGRSLAYPLFCGKLKPDALVLIDDFDHYPFLADLGRLFAYRELYRDVAGQQRWALVRLQGRVQGGSGV